MIVQLMSLGFGLIDLSADIISWMFTPITIGSISFAPIVIMFGGGLLTYLLVTIVKYFI